MVQVSGLYCERVLNERDGTYSAIRIVDQFTVEERPEYQFDKAEYIPVPVVGFLSIRSDQSIPESFRLTFKVSDPAGNESQKDSFPLQTLPPPAGTSLIIKLVLNGKKIGIWWTEVIIDGTTVLRLPVEIIHRPAPVPGISTPSPKQT
jgi:hypothetical protein